MISKRAREIPPFIVMDVLEKAQEMERAGANVIHLEIGEPDFPTPACVKTAAEKALAEGKTGYTHSLGLLELREAICHSYRDRYGVAVDPGQIVVTSGTSPAMLLVFGVLLDPGEAMVLPNPYYSCYPNLIRFVGGRPVFVPVAADDGFQFDPNQVRAALDETTKGVVVNSPSNPCGTVLEPDRMEQIASIARPDHYIVSDEIYHGLVYEGRASTVLEHTDRGFVINGFSKLYAMTGWRLGFVIAPQDFVRPLQKLQQNLFISANNFVQWAGIAALEEAGPDIEEMRRTYDKRRHFMVARLEEIGFEIPAQPTGAFYVLADARRFGRDSYKLALKILEETSVAVTPGIDFGDRAEGYLRFTYANSIQNIREAMSRLEEFLNRS